MYYIVKYSFFNSELFINIIDNVMQIFVINLRKFINYFFIVWVVNNIGIGLCSVDDVRNIIFEDGKCVLIFIVIMIEFN